MKTMEQIKQDNRLRIVHEGEDGGHAYGALKSTYRKEEMVIVFSWGGGWDHVSASCAKRTPSWDEMCELKEIFFDPDETVVQFHARQSEYINYHQHCLHLWKKQGSRYDLPPGWMVGPKPGQTEEECQMEALVALERQEYQERCAAQGKESRPEIVYANDNFCLMCNASIPQGSQVCPKCAYKADNLLQFKKREG